LEVWLLKLASQLFVELAAISMNGLPSWKH
jgi:hypothetical protein